MQLYKNSLGLSVLYKFGFKIYILAFTILVTVKPIKSSGPSLRFVLDNLKIILVKGKNHFLKSKN